MIYLFCLHDMEVRFIIIMKNMFFFFFVFCAKSLPAAKKPCRVTEVNITTYALNRSPTEYKDVAMHA